MIKLICSNSNKLKSLLIIFTMVLLSACGNTPNKTGWSLGTGVIMGSSTFALTRDPRATIVATGVGLALGQHIGSKFDEVVALRNDVLNLNKDGEVSTFTKVDEGKKVEVAIAPVETKTINNKQCRQYNYAYTKNGETSHGQGVACLNGEGEWKELFHSEG